MSKPLIQYCYCWIYLMRQQEVTWDVIAQIMGCNPASLYAWRKRVDFKDPSFYKGGQRSNRLMIDVKEVLVDRQHGLSFKRIAARQHVSESTLRAYLREVNFQDDFNPNPHKPTVKMRHQAKIARQHGKEIGEAYYYDHVPATDIAKQYDISESAAYAIIYDNKPLKIQLQVDRGKVIALLKAGWSVEAVAYELCITPKAVIIIARHYVNRMERKTPRP